jgi:hypothetical protein
MWKVEVGRSVEKTTPNLSSDGIYNAKADWFRTFNALSSSPTLALTLK